MLIFQWLFLRLPNLRRWLAWVFIIVIVFGHWLPPLIATAFIGLAIGGLINIAFRFCAAIAATVLCVWPLLLFAMLTKRGAPSARDNDRVFYGLFWIQQFFAILGMSYFGLKRLDLSNWQQQFVFAASAAEYLGFLIMANPVDKGAVFWRDVLSGALALISAVAISLLGIFLNVALKNPASHPTETSALTLSPLTSGDVLHSYNFMTAMLLLFAATYLFASRHIDAKVRRDRAAAIQSEDQSLKVS